MPELDHPAFYQQQQQQQQPPQQQQQQPHQQQQHSSPYLQQQAPPQHQGEYHWNAPRQMVSLAWSCASQSGLLTLPLAVLLHHSRIPQLQLYSLPLLDPASQPPLARRALPKPQTRFRHSPRRDAQGGCSQAPHAREPRSEPRSQPASTSSRTSTPPAVGRGGQQRAVAARAQLSASSRFVLPSFLFPPHRLSTLTPDFASTHP